LQKTTAGNPCPILATASEQQVITTFNYYTMIKIFPFFGVYWNSSPHMQSATGLEWTVHFYCEQALALQGCASGCIHKVSEPFTILKWFDFEQRRNNKQLASCHVSSRPMRSLYFPSCYRQNLDRKICIRRKINRKKY
jgi:hypothetical protein